MTATSVNGRQLQQPNQLLFGDFVALAVAAVAAVAAVVAAAAVAVAVASVVVAVVGVVVVVAVAVVDVVAGPTEIENSDHAPPLFFLSLWPVRRPFCFLLVSARTFT